MSERDPWGDALGIVLTYVALTVVWVVGTDVAVRLWVSDPALEAHLETAKGIGFALITGALFFWWIRRTIPPRLGELRHFRTLTEHVPALIFRLQVRPELKFEYVSPGSVNLAGYEPWEFYEKLDSVLGAVHPDDRDRLQRLISDTGSSGESIDLRWIHKDGHTVWSEVQVTRHRDRKGHVERVEGCARDVTERRRAEERNEQLATAVEQAGEAVFITDAEGSIEYVNPAFTEITGYEADEVVGRNPRMFKSGEQDEAFYEELWKTITAGRTFRGKMINRRKDGTLYDQEATITPVREGGDEIRRFVAVARDVTVKNEMERQLHRNYKMAAVGQMAAGISHDFRNLLNVIRVNARLLAEELVEDADDARWWQIREIDTAADRGAEMVGKLLTLARERELKLRVVDLSVVVRELEQGLRALLPGTVSLVLEVDEPVSVSADEAALQHVLLNLVMNAADAMPSGGILSLTLSTVDVRPPGPEVDETAEHPGGYARVSVKDTGVGIEREALERIFDPFFTTKSDGTGLGLSMARTLVHQHGGFVSVESEPGRGTTFELYFPRSEPVLAGEGGEGGTAPAQLSASRLPGGSERVLVVEDEGALRSAAQRVLRRLGYDVGSAADGAEALTRIEEDSREWDLVLADLVMPGVGGTDLYRTLQNRGRPIPFVFMSGYGVDEHGRDSNPDRFRYFLQKPWTVEDLAWKVREVLDARPARSYGIGGPPSEGP